MPFTVTLPKLSPTMEEGTIAKWHKKENEFVKAGELLIEVATDKATVEFNALDEGYLRSILISEGKSALVNQAIAIFTENKDESIEGYQPEGIQIAKQAPKEPEVQAVQTAAPQKSHAAASFQQPSFTPEAPLTDYVFDKSLEDRVFASPLAKRLAKEKNLDVSTVRGSGPHGRVTSKDLEFVQANTSVAFGRKEKPTVAPGTYEEIPLSPIRKIVAKRLQESKSFVPHFYVKQVIDAEPIFQLREQLKNLEIKISFNDFIIRACALALREHPEINCGFNSVEHSIIAFKTIDISVAVSLPSGLITPIVRHADFKNLGEISTEVRYLAKKAREGKLEEKEYKGGSFCISNLGMFGITEFSAILNPPQAAILAVGGIEDQPVVKNGLVVVGKTLVLTLSVDHRVIDGDPAARFLKTVQKLLENPASLII